MSHEKLKWMKETLIELVEAELCHPQEVNTCELGEAIDMIKDLEEAIYYATVTEAMHSGDNVWEMKEKDWDQEDRMYYRAPRMYPRYMYMDEENGEHTGSKHSKHLTQHMDEPYHSDEREGISHKSRRMYMEAREMNKDKTIQLRELEKYMQELSQDVVEMISDASPEEKQYLEKKISALAVKVGQMK